MKTINFSYYLINNFSQLSPGGITPMKLQKLLYYVFAWSLVAKTKFLDAKFEKWDFGPVNPEVYYHFTSIGKNSIPCNKAEKIDLSDIQKKFVDFVVCNYIKYDAVTLSAMTHKDLPWQITPKNQIIDEKSIKKFYSKLNFAKNFPLGESQFFYPVETDLHYAYILDMPTNIGKDIFQFDSYDEYLKLEKLSQKQFEKEIEEWLQ